MTSRPVLNRVLKFQEEAIKVAHQSSETKCVGCVLTKSNNIISSACNQAKTHPLQAFYANKVGQPERVFLHAELRSLIHANDDADTAFVARVNKKGDLRNAKPCPVCTAALIEYGVEDVYYTVQNGWEYIKLQE